MKRNAVYFGRCSNSDSFGPGGEIDLTEDLIWPTNRLHHTQTSPPVVYKDLVILGNGVGDRLKYLNAPPGDIQAFDVRTERPAKPVAVEALCAARKAPEARFDFVAPDFDAGA